SCVEDGQRHLARPSLILKTVDAGRRIDNQIVLRVLEFLEESIFEDIDFVQIARAPGEMRLIADVADVEYGVVPQLALDAEVVVFSVWGAQSGIESTDRPSIERVIRFVDDFLIVGSGERERGDRQRIGDDVRQRVKRRQGRLSWLSRNESGRTDCLACIRPEVCREKLRAFVVYDQSKVSPHNRL